MGSDLNVKLADYVAKLQREQQEAIDKTIEYERRKQEDIDKRAAEPTAWETRKLSCAELYGVKVSNEKEEKMSEEKVFYTGDVVRVKLPAGEPLSCILGKWTVESLVTIGTLAGRSYSIFNGGLSIQISGKYLELVTPVKREPRTFVLYKQGGERKWDEYIGHSEGIFFQYKGEPPMSVIHVVEVLPDDNDEKRADLKYRQDAIGSL